MADLLNSVPLSKIYYPRLRQFRVDKSDCAANHFSRIVQYSLIVITRTIVMV